MRRRFFFCGFLFLLLRRWFDARQGRLADGRGKRFEGELTTGQHRTEVVSSDPGPAGPNAVNRLVFQPAVKDIITPTTWTRRSRSSSRSCSNDVPGRIDWRSEAIQNKAWEAARDLNRGRKKNRPETIAM